MKPNDLQIELIHEDWRDALRHLVKALGGFEVVGADLWPAKTRKASGNWLSDCLNPERPAKLDIEEIEQLLRMGRAAGIHIGMHFLCTALCYGEPTTVEPKDAIAEVERHISRHVRHLEDLLAQYHRARELRAVK